MKHRPLLIVALITLLITVLGFVFIIATIGIGRIEQIPIQATADHDPGVIITAIMATETAKGWTSTPSQLPSGDLLTPGQ